RSVEPSYQVAFKTEVARSKSGHWNEHQRRIVGQQDTADEIQPAPCAEVQVQHHADKTGDPNSTEDAAQTYMRQIEKRKGCVLVEDAQRQQEEHPDQRLPVQGALGHALLQAL